jgi:hypothetical protein
MSWAVYPSTAEALKHPDQVRAQRLFPERGAALEGTGHPEMAMGVPVGDVSNAGGERGGYAES